MLATSTSTSQFQERLSVNDVADILRPQYAIISGGKSREGCPVITFPDNNNFHTLTDAEYQKLLLYLTSVPSLQEADLGFHLIVDRRKDRWNSVKTVLLKVSVYFPGLIQVVYVIRPASFLQKALSEVSNKLFKDEFKFRIIELSTVDELNDYIDVSQLTPDLGGSFSYCHERWIELRLELEKFSVMTHHVSNALLEFTKNIDETELPNDVDSTQCLLNNQSLVYSELKEEVLSAARHGENLLCEIKNKSTDSVPYSHNSDAVFIVERLLVQLEETERTFDDFWQQHSTKLRHCLELRSFEQDFRELQTNFDAHLKTISEMIELGDSVVRIDMLIKETAAFEKLCQIDAERAEEVISLGQHLITLKNSCPLECVEPKCSELVTMRGILLEQLWKRIEQLQKRKEVIEKIDKCERWCLHGQKLLSLQKIDACSKDIAGSYIEEIQAFLNLLKASDITECNDFKSFMQDILTAETRTYVTQVLQNMEDVSVMCEKQMNVLKKIIDHPFRHVQPIVPKQPICGAPHPKESVLRKAHTIHKMESSDLHIESEMDHDGSLSPENDEVNRVKRGHVLDELLQTEKMYVSELHSIVTGYIREAQSEELQHILPNGMANKADIIFGNLEEIYNFHQQIFLKDLENCISSTDLVALCFVQKRDAFYRLYSYYCQNIPRSEQTRETLVDSNMFFQKCQQKLGHKLPLAAYLLKPVQRITKYQLLLKDLLRYSSGDGKCSRQLQQSLECMLVVLRCVNDSMHQISITGFSADLTQQGGLLMQGSFSVWTESKKDLRLRLKPLRRHIFLYQKAILFCKATAKTSHNKASYQFKHYLKMSQIGLTESVKGDPRKFEIWLQGRQEVYTIQASNVEQKHAWVNEIKGVLLNQLEELKGEKIKQYSAITHKPLRQTVSWEKQKCTIPNAPIIVNHRTMSCDMDTNTHSGMLEESIESIEVGNWSSECSNSEDEHDEHPAINTTLPSGHYVALADYCAVGSGEVSMREGDMVELLKIGCAGWWFVKVIGTSVEGWVPASYLENLHRKSSRSISRSQDKLNEY